MCIGKYLLLLIPFACFGQGDYDFAFSADNTIIASTSFLEIDQMTYFEKEGTKVKMSQGSVEKVYRVRFKETVCSDLGCWSIYEEVDKKKPTGLRMAFNPAFNRAIFKDSAIVCYGITKSLAKKDFKTRNL